MLVYISEDGCSLGGKEFHQNRSLELGVILKDK